MVDVGFRPRPRESGADLALRLIAVGMFAGFVATLVWMGVVR